jgi:preprotein translocase subunit SecD
MKFTWKIWLLIAFLLFSLISIFSIPPLILEKGVMVKSVEKNSSIFDQGLRQGMILTSINGNAVTSLADYETAINIFSDNQTHKLDIITKNSEIIGLFSGEIINQITVENIQKTKIKTGLDIQGGARALIIAKDHKLTDAELDDLIAVSKERFNVFGLTDVNIRKASDLSGNKFMVVEIAGSTPTDLENLIAQQGKFEAKIGNDTIFIGGKQDITYVASTGQDAGIETCSQVQDGSYACRFRFSIYLSQEAAQRQADITSNISVNSTSSGRYLSEPLDLFVDDKLVDSLMISEELKGKATTQISVQGSGTGKDRADAFSSALVNMKQLQTILKTGSLPFKLQIEKIDRISPLLGNSFTKAILTGGLFAILAVSIIIFIRYRKIKISLALLITSFSELIIILGVAAFINWNLDLPSIAGIIATIGTGVDSQIVILDESRFKTESLVMRIKRALFIIFTSFATAFVSLIPLTGFLGFMGIGAAGAGLLKGFAVTTLIGITAGVFITRPAFADIIKQIESD